MSRKIVKNGKLDINNWDLLSFYTRQSSQTVSEAVVHPRHLEIGLHYQQFLYGLLLSLPPGDITVVETGVRTGISTYFILTALKMRGENQGHLFSCDPMYPAQHSAENRFRQYENFPYWKNKDNLFDNWTMVGEKSESALPKILKHATPWDVFIHDSNHSSVNMKFELEFAWANLKPGGFLIADDHCGNEADGRHNVFEEWANANDLPWGTIGQAVIVQKPGGLPTRIADLMTAPLADSREGRIVSGLFSVDSVKKEIRFSEDNDGFEIKDLKPTKVADTSFKNVAGTPLPAAPQTIEEMEAAVAASVAGLPPAPPAEEEKAEDDTNLDDLADLNKPGKAKNASVNFSDDDLDDLDDEPPAN